MFLKMSSNDHAIKIHHPVKIKMYSVFFVIVVFLLCFVTNSLARNSKKLFYNKISNNFLINDNRNLDNNFNITNYKRNYRWINSSNLIKNYNVSHLSRSQSDFSVQKINIDRRHKRRRGSRGQRQRMNKNALRLLSGPTDNNFEGVGAFPPIFNIAPRATISVNATCGLSGREEYCKLVDAQPYKTKCTICDAHSLDLDKRHPIDSVLDNSNGWWQSSTLQYGKTFEYVTITIDLKQIYQIFFIMLKSAVSPRPASWILEKSIDNITFEPWQYFGISDADCQRRYGLPSQTGKYLFKSNTEVICTTQFSKPQPIESGEIHISLLKNRPGSVLHVPELMDFIRARYIRFRFQGMHSTANSDNSVGWLLDPQSLEKQSFYSLKSIRISGRFDCNGHAERTSEFLSESGESLLKCNCLHNTCGDNCDHCCPLYNQKPYQEGTYESSNQCEECQCNGHAELCIYEPGQNGNGICYNCTNHTQGMHCEQCKPGYYRPKVAKLSNACEKCECNSFGSTGDCDQYSGECFCNQGFTGKHCELCAVGYQGMECTKCACDKRGTIFGGECDNECKCKLNVEGENCSICSLGYFGLRYDTPEGCTKCFCSGVSSNCKSAFTESEIFESLDGWKVTDIKKTMFAYPTQDNETGALVFGMYELPNIESVYWLAPKVYTGQRLKSYGSMFSLKVSWVVIRGDTSGKPTIGPNLILIGRNGIKIAYGDDVFDHTYAFINILLTEKHWYHIPSTVKDIVTRSKRTEYHGDIVSRDQFMSVLSDVETILIRATFHTDQVETILEEATISSGQMQSEYDDQSLIEECNCPLGYSGLSCEKCAFGYIRVNENNTRKGGVAGHCIECPCNGHAITCDMINGKCGECLHNTFGDRCERCLVGFYGNPMRGLSEDCKRCACPLLEDSNNFSPSCQLKKLSLDINQNDLNEDSEYICTQCPEGYTGDHCEFCDDGFYGNPMILGSKCQPCSCEDGPCHPFTGECVTCVGNTEGWKCERCKTGFWGDPEYGCIPCDCYSSGSLTDICDINSGQCVCKSNFKGIKCNECAENYTDINRGCISCNCNINGSINLLCDPENGECKCKLGVTGIKCDECLEGFYGLSEGSCNECHCNAHGSRRKLCDRNSGQCICHVNVTGRRCDKCQPGNWNLTSGEGCRNCQCDSLGAKSIECNPWTGQCDCKIGVEGSNCDRCQEGFYGLSNHGCKPCETCPSDGHVCDPDTGRCICPLYSKGPDCQQCLPHTWGWSSKIGCQQCDCTPAGSIGQMCDQLTGQCTCREGYMGRRCDICSYNYYGYPECKRCNCHSGGSYNSINETYTCDDQGKCQCKSLVSGLKCDSCKKSTFGISHNNPDGCTRCFCFGRSSECQQSNLSWGHIRLPNARNLSIQYINPSVVPLKEYEYVVVIQMEGAKTYQEDAEIQTMNGLNLVPSSSGNVSLGAYTAFYYPFYFQLPPQFYGDQTKSYGGNLRFSLLTEGANTKLESQILERSPLAQIHSHEKLILDYFEDDSEKFNSETIYNIPLHEAHWKYHLNKQNVNRAVMMAALQNVKHIFLRGTTWADFTQVVLLNVSMDSAIYLSGSRNIVAKGVESCECPERYSGLSCQNPGRGYFRWRNRTDPESLILEDLIGRVVPCKCNQRSLECDPETGVCLNCTHNTGGDNCERCAEGYYGDPNIGGCKPCPCPETSKNFARGCSIWMGQVNCICKPGYTGPLCERCNQGYYGSPNTQNGKCEPCNCSIEGSFGGDCDGITGQCNCKNGLIGRKCDKCEMEDHVLEEGYCKLCDNCTLILLDFIESIAHQLRRGIAHMDLSGIPPPWIMLGEYKSNMEKYDNQLENFLQAKQDLEDFDDNSIEKLESYTRNTNIQLKKQLTLAEKRNLISNAVKSEANEALESANEYKDKVRGIILSLNRYESLSYHINLPTALDEAKQLLHSIQYHAEIMDDSRKTWTCAWNDYDFYGNASDIVQDQLVDIEGLMIGVNTLNFRLSDTQRNVDKTLEILNDAEDIHEHNKNLKNYITEDNGQILDLENTTRNYLNNDFIPESETFLEVIKNGQAVVLTNIGNVKRLKDLLNQTLNEATEILRNDRIHWIPKAWKHSTKLFDRSNDYARQFETTKDGARVALLASSAHKNISEAIEIAKEAAEMAKQRVYAARNTLYPYEEESMIERGHHSLKKSNQLQKDAIKEMNKSNDLMTSLQEYQDKVESIKMTIVEAGSNNNNISSALGLLDGESNMKFIKENINSALKISNDMRKEIRKTNDLNSNIYKLREKFKSLEPDWDMKFGLAEENVSQTLSQIRMANKSLSNYEMLSENSTRQFQTWNNSISKQLKELKDKIAKARHAAEGIKVSLESLNTNCIRSYMPTSFGLSTSNTLTLTFALNNKNGNSPLIFIQGKDNKFIALEMIKRKIRLLWNLGGETGIVTHPLEIQTRDPKYDDAWYHIEANRTLNIGSLLVRRMTNYGFLEDSTLYTGVTSSEYTRFFRTTLNRVWLGAVPNKLRGKELLAEPGLNVIVHQAYIDNKPIGLWNYVHSEGECTGAMLGAQETSSTSNARHFNGYGYSQVKKSRPRPYRKTLFALQMTFKTLDENALLFLAVDDKNNRSVSVTLNMGLIVFRIDYGAESSLEINTTKKYNTGKWISIEAAREFVPKRGTENGSLKVNIEEPLVGSPTAPISASMLPDLSKAVYYLGGVPPGFRSGTTKAPGADNPFMGCMMDIQINGETYDPLDSTSYFGVEQSCKEAITRAGFYGNGYVELPSQSLRKKANLGFVFRTLQPESLLLLSIYPPSVQDDYDSKDLRANYSISIIDGHIHVWIDTGRGKTRITTNYTVNDGEFHVLNIIKQGRKIEIMIDDELQAIKSIPGSPTVINMPKDAGGLYFGGVPNFENYSKLAASLNGFAGSIRDIVFNNKTLLFSEALSFNNVHIGRSGPEMGSSNGMIDILMKTEPIGKSFTASPEGCQRVGSYSYEPNAFKFGDSQYSHSQLNIPIRHLWQKNFNIKFDFRTFYPNGIILIAPGTKEKQKHFIALLVKDGHLLLIVRGRRREELKLTAKLNDGKWHHVSIICRERKITMSVEIGKTGQKTSAQMKIPKKISASNMIFIGGVPENSITLPNDLIMKLEGFKGCIRKMSINNATQDLARPEKHLNVGQCFPNVEKGSYFPGDAYAIYKKNFHVGKYLELELEFRTSEMNGVLLSVSEPVGFPALSLEINKGNIVLSCDLGDGNPLRVESIFPSKYTLCDNKWHNISALYDFEQIALRIDNYPAIISVAQHRIAGKVHTKSPLYIGGIPDIAPSGTLLSRDNFKGCIRNVSIRNERRDWIDMDGLHNVLLSECLAVN